MKIRKVNKEDSPESPDYVFLCPACAYGHGIWTTTPNANGALWEFDGNFDAPSIKPSVMIQDRGTVCHAFIKAGRIEFLGDCTNPLKGQTVDMVDF